MDKLTKTQQEVMNLLKEGNSLELIGGLWYVGDKKVSRHTVEALIAKDLIKPTGYGLR